MSSPSSSIAIIDIGSNSVRLIIYESLSRSPVPLFNEKVLCGLGRHISTTGELSEESMQRAYTALRRYRLLSDQNDSTIHAFATAAVRDATNGTDFVQVAESILGVAPKVLSGRQEAYYAALGIVCGFQSPHGLAADLGGGSVEFTHIDGDPTGDGMTLPLGVLRLLDTYNTDFPAARRHIESQLPSHDLFTRSHEGVFYAVGGTWRSFAALHMERIGYPFRIMHHYELDASIVQSLCEDILSSCDIDSVEGSHIVSSSRRPLLPYGAMVLSRIISLMSASRIIFSAFGVREGYLYSLFPEPTRADDPLLVSANYLCHRYSRSPAHADELDTWTRHAFDVFGLSLSPSEDRLRRIACLVSDIAWRSSPDYRAGQALNFLLHANFVGIDHAERSFVALSSYYRHRGFKSSDSLIESLCSLSGESNVLRAKLLGELFRLAFLFSSGKTGILPHLSFSSDSESLLLEIPQSLSDFAGESVHRRLTDLCHLLDRKIHLSIVPS